jgi:stage II sporulation protein R
MKKLRRLTLYLLIVTLLLAYLPTDAEAKIYEDTLRLHILANSDSEKDQELKLLLRDEILLSYGDILKKCGTKSEAEDTLEEILPEIEEKAESFIASLGFSYDVRATVSVEWYETRDYDDFSLPCGYYTSLRIIIGEGGGRNWWCVMYPPLCTELATEDAPSDDGLVDYSNEEILLIKGGKYRIKFKILEDLSRTFAKK